MTTQLDNHLRELTACIASANAEYDRRMSLKQRFDKLYYEHMASTFIAVLKLGACGSLVGMFT